jgi:hypothetical protein
MICHEVENDLPGPRLVDGKNSSIGDDLCDPPQGKAMAGIDPNQFSSRKISVDLFSLSAATYTSELRGSQKPPDNGARRGSTEGRKTLTHNEFLRRPVISTKAKFWND